VHARIKIGCGPKGLNKDQLHNSERLSSPVMPQHSIDSAGVVFLHGWCGHGDEADHLRPFLSERLLAPSWMPAPGSIDLADWPQAPGAAMDAAMAGVADGVLRRVRLAIVEAGFAGSLLIGHSMGGAMACLLAADPEIAAQGLVLLDSSVPMPSQRRADTLQRMGGWIARAAQDGRTAAQAAWADDQPARTAHFFNPQDQGPRWRLIERRMAHAPLVEAAAVLGGYVQWLTDVALQQVRCPVLALAADPARLPVAEFRQARPDADVHTTTGCGHFQHVFAPERIGAQLVHFIETGCRGQA